MKLIHAGDLAAPPGNTGMSGARPQPSGHVCGSGHPGRHWGSPGTMICRHHGVCGRCLGLQPQEKVEASFTARS